MIHGGSNFGLTAGANAQGVGNFMGHITSYDYDAPINERGNATDKYWAIRDLVKKYVSYPIPDPPKEILSISIESFSTEIVGSIWDILPKHGIQAKYPSYFEKLN